MRTKVIAVRCTESERDEISEHAMSFGLDVSTYMRLRALDGRPLEVRPLEVRAKGSAGSTTGLRPGSIRWKAEQRRQGVERKLAMLAAGGSELADGSEPPACTYEYPPDEDGGRCGSLATKNGRCDLHPLDT